MKSDGTKLVLTEEFSSESTAQRREMLQAIVDIWLLREMEKTG